MSFWILFPFILIEIFVVFYMIIKLFMQNKIADIKSTKYFIPTLLINLAIYLIAVLQTATSSIFEVFLSTLEYGTKACFLGVETDLILPLVESSTLFSIAFFLSYFISVFTFVYVFIALVGRYISNFFKVLFINLSNKGKVVIIGFNEDTKEFYKSIKKDKKIIFWVPTFNKDEIKELLSNKKYSFVFEKISEKGFAKFKRGKTIFISFLQNDKDTLEILDVFGKIKTDNYKLFCSVDGNFENTYKTNFNTYNINFFNKYNLIAQKFIMDFPITSLIDSKFIDTTTATIDDKLEINVFLIGYGDVNKSLFKDMFVDNQFVSLGKNGKLKTKKVNYYLFDKREYMGDKNFSYSTNRYFENLESLDKSKYYDLPENPFNLEFTSADIYSKKFYNTLREMLNKQDRKNSFNIIITSFSNDLENIDQNVRLNQTFTELGFNNIVLFTRLKSKTYMPILQNYKQIKAFGEFSILNYDTIVNDKLNQFSIDRNFQLALKNADTLELFESFNAIRSVRKQIEETEKLKLKLWKDLNPIIKDYSKYQSINLRTKLNLIGLDTTGTIQITNKEFYACYDTLNEIVEKNRRKEYKMPYPTTLQPRNVLAMQEHLHTVAFLVSQGYLPMQKSDILNLKINDEIVNTKLRTALRLTSFESLNTIYKDRKEALKPNEDELVLIDLKKEIYQVMDDTPLHKYSNYLIYKK